MEAKRQTKGQGRECHRRFLLAHRRVYLLRCELYNGRLAHHLAHLLDRGGSRLHDQRIVHAQTVMRSVAEESMARIRAIDESGRKHKQ